MADEPKIKYGTEAQTRFTRTPVTISNIDDLIDKLKDLGIKAHVEDEEGNKVKSTTQHQATGGYNPFDKTIHIEVSHDIPYKEALAAIGHEDVHALLSPTGYAPPAPTPTWTDVLRHMFGMANPVDVATQGFMANKRAGDINTELPAYVAATPQYLGPDFTEVLRQQYINQQVQSLPAKVGELYRRLSSLYNPTPANQ